MFLASTFGFYVFFEHGVDNYPENAAKEFDQLKTKVEEMQAGKDPKPSPKTL